MALEIRFKPVEDKPVYAQIVLELKRMILNERAKNGDLLPSRREIAMTLGINPNTAQKAYKLMEEEGIIVTPNNAPSCVNVSDEKLEEIKRELTEDFITEFVHHAKQNKLSYETVALTLKRIWGDKE